MRDRYACQIAVPEIGSHGQARLARASVLVVGAGGLGSAALQYLGAAGVSQLVVVDPDQIEESNLHRQPLYCMSELGLPKARVARDALLSVSPSLRIEAICEALTPANAAGLISAADVIVDAADSFAVTYTLSDFCQDAGKPLVSASVLGLSGYAGVFCGGGPSYRAVFPEIPVQAGTCAQSGVLGTAVGVIGTLQAQLVVSTVLGLQPSVLGQLVSIDFRSLRFGTFCFADAREPVTPAVLRFVSRADVVADDVVVDLRARQERDASPCGLTTIHAMVDEIAHLRPALPHDRRIVLCCRSGVRAWRAGRILQQQGYDNLKLIALG